MSTSEASLAAFSDRMGNHMPLTVFDLAAGLPQSPAIFCSSIVVTYAELRQRTLDLARGLMALGCSKGDRIGIWSENSPFFVTSYLAIMRAGCVAVPFQADATADTFARITRDAGLTTVLVSQRFTGRLKPFAEELGVRLIPEPELANLPAPDGLEFPKIDPDRDLAALMFTSGSTGAPKGVTVTHRNIVCNTRDIIQYMGLTSDDRAMVVLPFHYCFGLSLLHTHLAVGASLVLNNNFKLYPETVLQEMQQKECTGIAGVPSTYQILLRKSRFRQMSFPKLRWFQQAGGKLPNACIAEILQSFPRVRYFLMYGQTEATARLSYLPPDRLTDKLGSIGKGLPSTTIEVLKPDGSPVPPGSNEIGEIVASGDNIAPGYWNDPAETAKFFRNGKLFTGDLARVDQDGFIFIVERERDMIKSGGNRVSAKEIEDAIAELPDVVEVAVVGAPHDLLGEAIKAFVVPTPKATLAPSDIEAHCRKRLPLFKTPEEVIFLKAMPHNGSGKILKPKLKELLHDRPIGKARVPINR